MKYDFDTIVDRTGTDCYKFDFAKEQGMPEDALPLWVADMDFPTARCIQDALHEVVERGIFGYTGIKEDYFAAVSAWYETHFHWTVKRQWLVMTPGVVFAVTNAIRAFTQPGEKVLIQQPVYYPFASAIKKNGRIPVNNALKEVRTSKDRWVRYEMDFVDLEAKLSDPALTLMILCSPHNPVGRVWTKEELCRLEELCLKYEVIVVSDEIHSDFVWDGAVHQVLANLDPRYEKNTVICTAPSKTFNLAGLQMSNLFIPNPALRCRYTKLLSEMSVGNPNQMGLAACRAAYTGGGEWLSQVKAYIAENIRFAEQYLKEMMPKLRMTRPEGTYLLWIDFRALGLSQAELTDFVLHQAGLWLDEGTMFGPGGEGFERINVACSRQFLTRALEQLHAAYQRLELRPDTKI